MVEPTLTSSKCAPSAWPPSWVHDTNRQCSRPQLSLMHSTNPVCPSGLCTPFLQRHLGLQRLRQGWRGNQYRHQKNHFPLSCLQYSCYQHCRITSHLESSSLSTKQWNSYLFSYSNHVKKVSFVPPLKRKGLNATQGE